VKTIFPVGVLVSMLSDSDTKSMPRDWKSSRARRRCETDLANRSKRHTNTTSKRRLRASMVS
jgi:hypothetical protein